MLLRSFFRLLECNFAMFIICLPIKLHNYDIQIILVLFLSYLSYWYILHTIGFFLFETPTQNSTMEKHR